MEKKRQQQQTRKRSSRPNSLEDLERNTPSDRDDASHRSTDSSESVLPNSDVEDCAMSNRTLESLFEDTLDISEPVPMILTSTAADRLPTSTSQNGRAS